ncbi:MAG: ABC transporter permease [Acidimicrobiales bacterium]
MLRRDVYVTGRELPIFLAQVILQPLFLLFIFGKVLTQLGYAHNNYAQILFPGMVSLATVLTALQSTAMPLVMEFSYTKEIEDRLLAPMPVWLVAVEKIVFATVRAMIAAAVMFPVGILILGSIPFKARDAGLVVLFITLGGLVGAAIGMVLGTLVPPNRINIMFALILTPLLFTGASQYPWPSLSHIRWFQVVTGCNPLTYVSEGMRGSMLTGVPHIAIWISFLVLIGALAVLLAIGLRGFMRRAVT